MKPEVRAAALILFEEALERAPGERATFVAEQARDRPEVRAEVEALLELESAGPDMPRVEATPDVLAALGGELPEFPAGTRVGTSTLLRPLGSGGMGRVYLAEQEAPRRRVALKTLLRDVASEDSRRRFQVEGELLGHLSHPGIAQVYETGVQRFEVDGRVVELPFITMELLEDARPIVEFARVEGLSEERRVQLLLQVARAVHHAHQKGVIHRDLKPANLLVDASGSVRVIDFGIARAGDLDLAAASVHTVAGQLMGTPAYMSPEQLTLAGHELDTRADVYALGAVAYELLCGVPPFEARGRPLVALAREIVDRGPARPRSVAKGLAPDLEAVLLRAMARDREERYASVAALADDLGRYLNHEAVQAQRTTALHQLRLFSRRHRLFTASVVLSALSLIAAAAVSATFATKALEAQQLERTERLRADELLAEVFEENLQLVFDFAEKASALRGGAELRRSMLVEAASRLEELEPQAQRDPRLLGMVARAHLRLGNALGAFDQQNTGDLEGAERAYDQAERLLAELGGDQRELIRARMDLEQARGDRARGATEFDVALEHYRRAIELGEEALFERPEDDGLRAELLRRHRDLGNTLGSMRDHVGALEAFEAVVTGWQVLLERHPGDLMTRYNLANARSSVASATMYAVGPAESLPVFRQTLEAYEEILRGTPDYRLASSALVGVRNAYTEALIHAKRFDESIDEARVGLALAVELLEDDPGDVQLQRWSGLLHYNTGWALESRAFAAEEAGARQEVVREDLSAALEPFGSALEVFTSLREAGKLLPFEQGHIPAIQSRLEQLESRLE